MFFQQKSFLCKSFEIVLEAAAVISVILLDHGQSSFIPFLTHSLHSWYKEQLFHFRRIVSPIFLLTKLHITQSDWPKIVHLFIARIPFDETARSVN